jgi:hypothetical protein
MLQHFECGFYVIASNNNWSRHIELPEALRIAKVKANDRHLKFCIITFLFTEGTPSEVIQNCLNCYTVDQMGNLVKCSAESLNSKDREDLKALVGFTSYNNKNCLKAKKAA